MYRSVCVLSALLSPLVFTLVVPSGQSCPRSCNCYQASEVHCTFRSLFTIPPGLPAYTRRINLGFNSINRIYNNSLAGLKRVELLMLQSNDIHHLPDAVFRDMNSLQILKLSYNKMREISSSMTFSGLTSLLRLYMDHNLLQYIHPRALLQLPSLRLLRLQGNRLHQLHPHTLCTLSLLNTYYFSTLRHLDLSNNSLTTLPKDTLVKAPLLETLVLHMNPWSCDCRMNWFLNWSLAHPGLMKCPSSPQCPVCASPNSLQEQGLLDQADLPCASPVISSLGRATPSETEISEIQSSEAFREPLGTAFLGLLDQQGNSVDLNCNISHSSETFPDLSLSTSFPLSLPLSLSLDCPVERQSYEKIWRILAYYSETAVRLEREIMLSKTPLLAYRYRQSAETGKYYHTGVQASVKARPQWLLQPAISIQLNRAQSNAHRVHLIYSTRVSAHPGPTSYQSLSPSASHPWVLISTNHTTTAVAAVSGSTVELSCPVLSSGNSKVHWILPDESMLIVPSSSLDGRLRVSANGLLLQRVRISDAGLYYCVAKTGYTVDVDILPIRLAVEESSLPLSGVQVGPPVLGIDGEPVSLTCKVSGSPAPHISWMFPDGNIIQRGFAASGGIIIQSNGSLYMPNPSLRDVGYYQCIAVNQYGSESLSMQLELKPQHHHLLRTSFPRGPQSAAGRSTKIRAPLLRQIEEGSGDEEEEEERTVIAKMKHPRLSEPTQGRRYPTGKPRRRGSMRGRPLSSTEKRRNHFDNRHRATSNKQRIDPQKWADLLAKIRQKTSKDSNSNSPPSTAGEFTPKPMGRSKDRDTTRHEGADDTETGRAEEAGVESETEGSSVDVAVLQEEDLQPIHHVLIGTQAHTEIKADTETESETQTGTETTTNTQNPGTQTNPLTQEPVTSKPKSRANEIVSEPLEGDEREQSFFPSRTRPQKPQQGLSPKLVPSSRPQSPWNSRRKIGQRRRINRPRVQPFTPPQSLPDPTAQRCQTVTADCITDQINMGLLPSTTTSSAVLQMSNDHIKIAPNSVALDILSSLTSYTLGTSTSESVSTLFATSTSSVTSLFPSYTKTHIDIMTHSADIPDAAQSNLFNTPPPVPTHSDVVVPHTYVPDAHARTLPHGIQTYAQTHNALGKHVVRPPGKHKEEVEKNLLGVLYLSPSTTNSPAHSSIVPSPATATTAKITSQPTTLKSNYFTSSAGITTSTSMKTTISQMTTNPIVSTTRFVIIPSTTKSTTTTSTTSTTHIPTSTTTTSNPSTTTSTTTNTAATTITKITLKPIPTSFNATTTATTTATFTNSVTNYTKASPTTTRTTTAISSTTTTTTMSPTRTIASSRERSDTGQINAGGKLASRAPNQSRPPTKWKNPGANSIPESHSSRPQSPSLPAVPWVPDVGARPRIADPHIRTVSFPAGNTARLACEAQGQPKPSITWTKVATGAVMSIHSRAQRVEVLPNGTLVIQNVQLQDRGTYICIAQNSLGRDRVLTTLEVRTRPPRMQQVSYREATIHQGGELLLECQAEGVPAPVLSWTLPDRSVLTSAAHSTSRIFMDTNGTLHISAALPSDRGMYRCVASNSAGAASTSLRVHVSSLPPMIQQAKEEHLLLSPGRSVYAHCSARGAPLPTLRWRIPDGTLVRPSQFLHGNLFVLPNGTLHIRRIGPNYSGSYECTASNTVGTDKRTVMVELEGRAKEGIGEGSAKQAESKTVTTEKPSPSYSLNKDRALSIPSHRSNPFNSPKLSLPSLFDRSSQLALTSPSYPHQPNSSYPLPKINKKVGTTDFTNINKTEPVSPSIVNNANSDKSTASGVLQPLPNTPFTKARIIFSSPSITTVQYGGNLQLHCSVIGNPSPIIIWRTPSRKLVDMHFSFDQRLKVHPNGTLSVQAVTEKDAGDYLCITRNKVADDYRLLHVSVVTKPAKIEPKQPLNQMVSVGKELKVDCQATGLPDPAVHWSLPDGTMVNSVFQEEDRGGRARRLTVFDNGTLLVSSVGMGEEGVYTCYAENQVGQDIMKVKVKVMMTSSPTFTDVRRYHVIKVRQGATATIRCQATGDPAPTVTWFSPAHHVIPKSLSSGFYSERVVVVSGGTLRVHLAQKVDTGNYTCQAKNSVGETSMVVGLEVEAFSHGMSGQVGGRAGSTNNGQSNSRLGNSNSNNAGIIQYGFTSEATSKQGSNNNSRSSNSGNYDRTRHTVPNTGINANNGGSNPALRRYSQNGFNNPASGITTQIGSSGISVVMGGVKNIGNKADNSVINRNEPGIVSSISNSVANSHSRVNGENIEENPGNNNNEAIVGRTNDNTSTDNGRISGVSRNVGASSSVSNSGAGSSTFLGNGVSSTSGSSNKAVTNDRIRNSGILRSNSIVVTNTGTKNSTNTVGVVTTFKQRTVKGQTVVLPCPSQGSPPPRLSWLLPGNGVLPAPYYGSRLTVHRNGSLELRGVRTSDGGTLVCVVRGERGETRIQVELEVSESHEDGKSPHRGKSVERTGPKSVVLIEAPRSAARLDSVQSLKTQVLLPGVTSVTQKPLQRAHSLPAAPPPIGPPPRSTGHVSQPAVSSRTASLVSIINGETLRLPCPAFPNHGHTQGSLLWTMPSGKVLSRGENSDMGRYQVQEDGTLTVQQASVFDRGTYTCRFTSYDSSSASVITVPVIIIAYPPRITKGPSPVTYTRPGVAVELPCLTIATPQATVTWETPDLTQLKVMGQARIYGNRYLSPQGSLVIQKPTNRDTGFYRCSAKNVIGVDTKVTYLHVI
ncbi:Matrix-remodeling-associated protein 5 [Channa argus]|uniref:Matrix-remodeling-associated protein 5 n=1 Tax=Channa argus TaxID=215402 RepID=A0A6G1PXT7_CHAAH|nr:Matrix-remodeling-associated protein 5 [Channa argus]